MERTGHSERVSFRSFVRSFVSSNSRLIGYYGSLDAPDRKTKIYQCKSVELVCLCSFTLSTRSFSDEKRKRQLTKDGRTVESRLSIRLKWPKLNNCPIWPQGGLEKNPSLLVPSILSFWHWIVHFLPQSPCSSGLRQKDPCLLGTKWISISGRI